MLPLVLKSAVFGKEVLVSFLMRYTSFWIVPQFGQLLSYFILILPIIDIRLTYSILSVHEFFGFLSVWIFHPAVRVNDLYWNKIIVRIYNHPGNRNRNKSPENLHSYSNRSFSISYSVSIQTHLPSMKLLTNLFVPSWDWVIEWHILGLDPLRKFTKAC